MDVTVLNNFTFTSLMSFRSCFVVVTQSDSVCSYLAIFGCHFVQISLVKEIVCLKRLPC